MYVDSDCPSPSFALINQDTVWNNRSLSFYLLDHHSRVPPGQFNDTTIRVPSATKLCPKRNCPCPKKHLQKLDKKHIFQIAVEEKKEGAETILRSVMCRDDLVLSQTGYSVLHIPKSQTTFITSFNDRRTRICGDLRIFFWLFMCNSCSCNWHHWRAGTPKLFSHNSCTYTCLIYWRTMPRPGSHKSERFGQNEGALHSGRCPTKWHRPGFNFVGNFIAKIGCQTDSGRCSKARHRPETFM